MTASLSEKHAGKVHSQLYDAEQDKDTDCRIPTLAGGCRRNQERTTMMDLMTLWIESANRFYTDLNQPSPCTVGVLASVP
jgi:hypothetical protein